MGRRFEEQQFLDSGFRRKDEGDVAVILWHIAARVVSMSLVLPSLGKSRMTQVGMGALPDPIYLQPVAEAVGDVDPALAVQLHRRGTPEIPLDSSGYLPVPAARRI